MQMEGTFMIYRPLYLEKIMKYIDAPFVKILTGIRRCGKSVILKEILSEVEERSKNTIFLDFEDKITRHCR